MKKFSTRFIPILLLLIVGILSGTYTLAYPSPAQSSIDDGLSELEGLPLEEFFEESYAQLLRRDPELVTELGLTETLGMSNAELTNISDVYIRETQALESAILDLLREYNQDELSPEQQLSYDVYEWYLDDLVRQHEFMYYNYPVSHFIYSIDRALIHFFTETHPITNGQDAEDYITRLSHVDTKFEQLLEGLQIREELGVIPPNFVVRWSIYNLNGIAQSQARNTPFYTAFRDKVNALDMLSNEDKQTLLDAAETEINDTLIPAFRSVVDYLEHLETVATDDDGVWKLPNGEAYYEYVLSHHTTTDMTADEIHELGLQEVARIQAEIAVMFAELGYPEDASLSTLFSRAANDSGVLYGHDIIEGYEALIEDANQNLDEAFDLRPVGSVVVVEDEVGGYYSPPAMDGSRPGAFYANANGARARLGMPTLAYHETIPGHHFQIALAQELEGLPSFRNGVIFTAYAEGWALYAERLTWELGFYDDDPYGNLGRLQAEVWRAARLVVDTGVHARGWTYNQAVSYLLENTGLPRGTAEWEVSRYIVLPGQATSYKIGMLEILELRQMAMYELGDQFDIREFHNAVLGNGSMPLNILERVVQDYINSIAR